MSRLESALQQIRTARLYVKDLLGHIDQADWFRQPHEGVTHVAWQVGHLAVAQYGLALKRVRGEQPDDEALISGDFRQRFGKGSHPDPAPANNPSCEEICAVLDRVHQRTLDELAGLSDRDLDQPVAPPPHPLFTTKLGALHWCAQHEFIHAGQIALLRRLLGNEPLR